MNEAVPKNLYLDRRLIKAAESYVEKRKVTQRAYSFSQLIQELLVKEMKSLGVKLPSDFNS
jgi:hypothetical protein